MQGISTSIWQDYLVQFPKANRFTIGSKIDVLFLESIEYAFLASYNHTEEKQILLNKSISKFDLIKLLLQLCWEIKALDNKKYSHLSERFSEIGKMLGGVIFQSLDLVYHPASHTNCLYFFFYYAILFEQPWPFKLRSHRLRTNYLKP